MAIVGRSGAVPMGTRWYGRISGAHLVVALAGLLGGVLTLAALRADARDVRVLSAARDVEVGATLSGRDLTTITIRGDASGLASVLLGDDRNVAIGKIVASPLRRGDVLRRSDLLVPAVGGGARARSISFSVDAADAVGRDLAAGDRIDVLAASHDGKRAGYVLVDAAVLSASAPRSSGPLRTNDDSVLLTVSVSGDDALRLVGALSDARVVVVKATGARPLAQAPRYALPATAGASTGEAGGG